MCIHVSLLNDEQMSNKVRVVRTNLINMFQLCTVSIKIYIYISMYSIYIYIYMWYTCDLSKNKLLKSWDLQNFTRGDRIFIPIPSWVNPRSWKAVSWGLQQLTGGTTPKIALVTWYRFCIFEAQWRLVTEGFLGLDSIELQQIWVYDLSFVGLYLC